MDRLPAGLDDDPDMHELVEMAHAHMGMDASFVSEFTGGRRVFRAVSPDHSVNKIGGNDPLAETYCQRIVDGRLDGIVRNARNHPIQQPGLPR